MGSYFSERRSESPWMTSLSQGSSCTFDCRTGPTTEDRAFHTINRDDFFGFAFELPDLEADVTIQFPIQCPERGSQQPYATSTKNNEGIEKWNTPGTMDPPDSSSPAGLGPDSSPPSIQAAPALAHRACVTGRLWSGFLCDRGRSRVKALFNGQPDLNASIIHTATTMCFIPSLSPTPTPPKRGVPPVRTNMDAGLHGHGHPANTSRGGSSKPTCSAVRDDPLGATSERANEHDICAGTRTVCESTGKLDRTNVDNGVPSRGGPARLSRKRAMLSGPTMLDLAAPYGLESVSSRGAENDRPHNATTTSSKTNDDASSKIPPRRVAIASAPTQVERDNRLKRELSSADSPPESKKMKLDRAATHIFGATDTSVEPKYEATQPASLRRALSLRSEASLRSIESADSIFYPSPQSSPGSHSCADKEYPPTVANTPLPNSEEYERSKANPLVRTIRFYRRRSLDIPPIPPVPIIAPPEYLAPEPVRCSEDRAIDRLKALLERERLERERDGLNAWDEERAERLKMMCPTEPAFLRRDSGSTSESSGNHSRWEEETTRSATECQESQVSVPVVNILSEHRRIANREIWSRTFGITNEFRIEVTEWILKNISKEPVPDEKVPDEKRKKRRLDLYNHLTESRLTRFHAAQLFHRYFLLPSKVAYWREAACIEESEQDSTDNTDGKRGVWILALAFLALAVKLHRDVLPPLGPIFAAEFLELAPYPVTQDAFELAQRDIMYTFQFMLGSCTPQDVLEELWFALPTLRKATAPIRDGWAVVQSETWNKLSASLLEPDTLQYPVTLLTGAALIEGLISALTRHYETEAEAGASKCKPSTSPAAVDSFLDDTEQTTSQAHFFEVSELVAGVILDVKDVLELPNLELDECRKWMGCVGRG